MNTRSMKSCSKSLSEKENEGVYENEEIISVDSDGIKIKSSTEMFLVSEKVNKEKSLNDSLLEILTSTIDFLKKELKEKNELIKMLIFNGNKNGSRFVNACSNTSNFNADDKNKNTMHVETGPTTVVI